MRLRSEKPMQPDHLLLYAFIGYKHAHSLLLAYKKAKFYFGTQGYWVPRV